LPTSGARPAANQSSTGRPCRCCLELGAEIPCIAGLWILVACVFLRFGANLATCLFGILPPDSDRCRCSLCMGANCANLHAVPKVRHAGPDWLPGQVRFPFWDLLARVDRICYQLASLTIGFICIACLARAQAWSRRCHCFEAQVCSRCNTRRQSISDLGTRRHLHNFSGTTTSQSPSPNRPFSTLHYSCPA
jgi:hypothetical protein